MRQNFKELNLNYSVGSAETLQRMQTVPALEPFADSVADFLNQVSRKLLADCEAKAYPDVITLAFWMRRANVESLKKRFGMSGSGFKTVCAQAGAAQQTRGSASESDCGKPESDAEILENGAFRLGRGIAFHIAPSNVPVNYAYSLVTGLLCGNANVVRIPSRDFPQVAIINRAFREVLELTPELKPYICLVRYGHDRTVNDALSALADVRVIWGGDRTIAKLRQSPLKPRATEVTFADRYSLAVIDADCYLRDCEAGRTAQDFYNDTFLTDQNACTSPRAVVWTGNRIGEAKERFWEELHRIAAARYELQAVQAVNKLTSAYRLAAAAPEALAVRRIGTPDNLIVRVQVSRLAPELMEFKDNSGYFFEYDCENILELKDFCNDARCQTLSYIGDKTMFPPLIKSGIKGIDRIVPVGKTMDFDLMWDGYNLVEQLTRTIRI